MALPFVGEIRLFAGSVAPTGWAICDGQLVNREQYQMLFDLIGTTYGAGDGATTFALPDLRGRVPVHVAPASVLGQTGGQERVAVTVAELPAHTHALRASTGDGDRASPQGSVWARSEALAFSAPAPNTAMHASSLATTGQGAPHDNMMPFLGVNFMIALEGFPVFFP
jgi:microcystin-dependent protein